MGAHTDRWAMGYLRSALAHVRGGQLAWRGPELAKVAPEGTTERYPWLDEFVAALREEGGPGTEAGQVPLPVAIPYEMAGLAHPPGVGTRMIFSIAGEF
jgi:hypothetical protein